MKKLIAISMMIALVAGAVFAESSISGAIEIQWRGAITTGGIDGGNADEVYIGRLFPTAEGYFQWSGSNDDGTFRALYRLKSGGNGLGVNPSADIANNRAFIWWDPIPQLSLFFGRDEDGYFGQDHIAGWGFHRGARFVSVERFRGGNYFLGAGAGADNAFAISIKPIDGLQINASIANLDNRRLAEEASKHISAEIAYDLGVGRALVAYNGENRGNKFGFSFISTSLVEGIEFGAALAYNLTDGAVNPIGIGITFSYAADDWGVKFRSYIDGFDTYAFTADVMPWYNFGFIEGRLSIRVSMIESADFGWLINPYVVHNAGPAQLRAGIMISNMNDPQGWNTHFAARADGEIVWSIPVGLVFSF